jgi:hypothetical protein
LRQVLASHAHGNSHAGTVTIPPQEQAAAPTRPAHAELASSPRPSVAQG